MAELEKQPNIIKQFMESPLGKEIKAILQPDYCDRHDVYEIRNACLGDCAGCKAESVMNAVREAGYVLKSEDQELPENPIIPEAGYLLANSTYSGAQQDMINAGWVKIIEE